MHAMSDDLPMTDELARAAAVAKDARAPQNERYDATSSIAKATAGSVRIPTKADIAKAVTFANNLNNRLNTRQMKHTGRNQPAPGQPRSGSVDPYGIFYSTEYLARPAPLGFTQLKYVAQSNPITSAIVFTYMREVTRLAHPVQYDHEPGYRVRLRGRNGRLTPGEEQRVEWLERFIKNCGAEFDPFQREYLQRDDFTNFLSKTTMDSLTLDAMPIEVVRTRSGRIHGFVHVDGSTIFLPPRGGLPENSAPPEDADPDDLPERHLVKAVEAEGDGGSVSRVLNWFGIDEMVYRVRNPRPDVDGYGYGIAETELMMRLITAFQNVLTYNIRSFEDNHIPPGFLQLFGDFKDEDIEDFKAEWAAYVAGVSNSWRLPLLVSEQSAEAGAQFTKTGVEITDLQHVKFISMDVALQCALYSIDPESIGFESFSSRGATMSEGNVESKLENSRQKGLYPLLQHHAAAINNILQGVDEDAYFEWTGFVSPQESWERDQRALTFGELRERQGLERTGDETLDNAPIDGAMQGIYMQTIQQQMPMDDGMGGMPPGVDGQQLPPGAEDADEEDWPDAMDMTEEDAADMDPQQAADAQQAGIQEGQAGQQPTQQTAQPQQPPVDPNEEADDEEEADENESRLKRWARRLAGR